MSCAKQQNDKTRGLRKPWMGILGCLMLSLLVSCTDSGPAVGESSSPPDDWQEVVASLVEPIVFTALVMDNQEKGFWGQDPISREITNRTGVSLDFVQMEGSMEESMQVLIAGGNTPDMMLSIGNDAVASLARQGILVPLDNLIEEQGTHIRSMIGEDLNRMRTEQDGHIYGMNRLYQGVSNETNALFGVQYAMLEEAGFPKLKTLDDLHQLLKTHVATHPLTDDSPTIGLTAWADSFGINVSLCNPALRAGGNRNDGLYKVTGPENMRATHVLKTEEAHQYYAWLNRLHRDGLLDPSSVIQGRELFEDKMTSGRVLAVTTEYWDYQDLEVQLRANGMADSCFAKFPLLFSEDTPVQDISRYDPIGSWKSVITTSCDDVERAFQFFDIMWSEEMQILCNWGIAGIHHDIVNGKRVLRDDIYSQTVLDPDWKLKTGVQLYHYWSVGENVPGSDGQFLSPFGTRESMIQQQDESTKRVLKAYGAEIWKDLCPNPIPSEWGFAWTLTLPNDTAGALAEQQVNDNLRRRMLPRIILAHSPEAFEQEWHSLQASLDGTDIQIREREITTALRKRLSFWQSEDLNEAN